ncbi:MAG: endonuclease/exonuclease/phosphatase family protein [Flavobacteriaceae bacterium]
MKHSIKIIFQFFFIVFSLITGFFFWGSSSVNPLKDKNKIITRNTNITHSTDSIFSIATYNIGYLSGMTNNLPVAKPKSLFDNNLEQVKLVLKPLNIDILAFQEIDFAASRSYDVNQQLEIAKLGYPFIGQSVNWDKRYLPFPYWPISVQFGRVYSGQSVLSKYPIKKQDRIVLKAVADAPFYRTAFYLDRLAQVDKIDIEGKTLVIINVHLEAFDKTTRMLQTKRVLKLYNSYKDDYPTLLVGDFNSDIKYPNASITPIIKSANIGIAAYNTHYPNTYSSVKPVKRIDYIFYNKNFIAEVSSRVVSEMGDASDHLPLLMTFKLK